MLHILRRHAAVIEDIPHLVQPAQNLLERFLQLLVGCNIVEGAARHIGYLLQVGCVSQQESDCINNNLPFFHRKNIVKGRLLILGERFAIRQEQRHVPVFVGPSCDRIGKLRQREAIGGCSFGHQSVNQLFRAPPIQREALGDVRGLRRELDDGNRHVLGKQIQGGFRRCLERLDPGSEHAARHIQDEDHVLHGRIPEGHFVHVSEHAGAAHLNRACTTRTGRNQQLGLERTVIHHQFQRLGLRAPRGRKPRPLVGRNGCAAHHAMPFAERSLEFDDRHTVFQPQSKVRQSRRSHPLSQAPGHRRRIGRHVPEVNLPLALVQILRHCFRCRQRYPCHPHAPLHPWRPRIDGAGYTPPMPDIRLHQADVQFLVIRPSVVVCIQLVRPRAVFLLQQVGQSVAVRVFVAIPDPVSVRIYIVRIGARPIFINIVQAIAIRVAVGAVIARRIERIQAVEQFPPIRQTVSVGILVRREDVCTRDVGLRRRRHGDVYVGRPIPCRNIPEGHGIRSSGQRHNGSAVEEVGAVHRPPRPRITCSGRLDEHLQAAVRGDVGAGKHHALILSDRHRFIRRLYPAAHRQVSHRMQSGRQVLYSRAARYKRAAIHAECG